MARANFAATPRHKAATEVQQFLPSGLIANFTGWRLVAVGFAERVDPLRPGPQDATLFHHDRQSKVLAGLYRRFRIARRRGSRSVVGSAGRRYGPPQACARCPGRIDLASMRSDLCSLLSQARWADRSMVNSGAKFG
jgi:hypothetical protein